MASQFKDACPLCGAYSFDGAICQPSCDPGNLHHVGIDLLPMPSGGGFGSGNELGPRLNSAAERRHAKQERERSF